ncbi:MAG: glycosyltransferase family 39 protein [Candidatus Curtissbacteria bacterium]
MNRHFWIFTAILVLISVLRLPSLFEPFWYGDEGIFAAVARNLNMGGTLYQSAWDNKPPMIYLTYGATFQAFGVSMFSLRLLTLCVVLITAAAIYEIGQKALGVKRALVATAAFGILSSLRLIEANLALTEIFMILPITLAMLLAIWRKFDYLSIFSAGALFAIASLYKQVGALEAVALGLYLFFYAKNFAEFFKKGLAMTAGFAIVHAVTLTYFASLGLVSDYIFAAYTYYRIYLSESPKYALLINILKIMPISGAFFYCLWKKKKGELAISHLFLLWGGASFLGSFFSGRTYGHYLVQALPALSLILASFGKPKKTGRGSLVFLAVYLLPIIVISKVLFTGFGAGAFFEQFSYFRNFADFARGDKSVEAYNNYFDRNVNLIMATRDVLAEHDAAGQSVYIWGDWSWLYAIADLQNPSRYVTSFHVFGVPGGREEVIAGIEKSPPAFIVKAPSSIGNFPEFENIVQARYTPILQIGDTVIFEKINR